MGRLTMDADGKVIDLELVGTHTSEPAPETSPVATPTVRLLTGVVEHAARPSVVRLVAGDEFHVDLPGLPTEVLDAEGAARLAGALERAAADGAPAVAIVWDYGTSSHEDTMTAADGQALALNLRGALAEAA